MLNSSDDRRAVGEDARDAAVILVAEHHRRQVARRVVGRAAERANLAVLPGRVVDANDRAARQHELVHHRRHLLRREARRTAGRRRRLGAASATGTRWRRTTRSSAASRRRRRVGIRVVLRFHLRVVAALGGRGLLEGHLHMRTDEHNRAADLGGEIAEVLLHLRFRRIRGRDDVNRRADDRAVRRRRPRQHLEHEVVLHRREDMTGCFLIQPARPREVPRLEVAVHEAPGLHLPHRPLGGVLVVRRACQARPVHVGQVVHGLENLRVLHAFLANSGVHGLIDLFGGRRGGYLGGRSRDDQNQHDWREHLAQHRGTP